MRLSHIHEVKVNDGDDTYEVPGTVVRHAENLWDEFRRAHSGKIDRHLFLAKTESIAKTAAFESGYPWWVVMRALRSVLAQRDRKRRAVQIRGPGYSPRPRPKPAPAKPKTDAERQGSFDFGA